MPKVFQVNDLVWGKMKGYPPWPGKIIPPPSGLKPKKNSHYVFFFGTENSAWITDEFIELHTAEILQKYINRKGALLQKAIRSIVECSTSIVSSDNSSITVDEAMMIDTAHDERQFGNNPGYVEPIEQDDVNIPSTSGEFFTLEDFKQCAQSYNFVQLDYEDITANIVAEITSGVGTSRDGDVPADDIPHSDTVIPHPNSLNCSVPPEKVEYIERPESPPFDYSISERLKERTIVPTEKKIGFLGFTKVAQGIIKNLVHSGHSIIFSNGKEGEVTDKECRMFAQELLQTNVQFAVNPAEVMRAADVIFCCSSDCFVSNISKDQIFGSLLKELERSKGRKSYVEMTNIPPHLSEIVATEIKMRGGLYLEAPVCGTKVDATEGTLFISAAGDKTLYDDCESCFNAISKKHMYISPEIGVALKLNLVHNMFIGTTYEALAESMSLLEARGLGKEFLGVLQKSDLNSSGLVQKAEAMVKKNFQTETSVEEMQENFTLGLAQGHEVSHSTSVFSMANEAYKKLKH